MALGDQPRISADAVARVVSQRGADELAVRATYGGVPGHPVLLERTLLSRVGELRGDAGASELCTASRSARWPATASARRPTWTPPDALAALISAPSLAARRARAD